MSDSTADQKQLRVAVIGLGAMGLPMATHLATAFTVTGFDPFEPRRELAAEGGVIPAATPSEASREADIALVLPKATEACPNGLAPTTSTTMQIALGDALAVALLEARGFSRQDFFVYHPGGKLGAQLKTVESIMHRGAELPLIGLDTLLPDVVAMISARGFGCAVVMDLDGKLAE